MDWEFVSGISDSFVHEECNEHTKLGAPITDVVDTSYVASKILEKAAYGVSNDGGSQVTNVH